MIDFDAQIPRETDPASGLPIGPKTTVPVPAKRPERVVLDGRFCRLEPLNAAAHGDALYAATNVADAPARFLYLSEAPNPVRSVFNAWMAEKVASADPLYFAVIDKRTGRCEGRQTLMRIDPPNLSIEIGHIYWGPAISRTPVTTEAKDRKSVV